MQGDHRFAALVDEAELSVLAHRRQALGKAGGVLVLQGDDGLAGGVYVAASAVLAHGGQAVREGQGVFVLRGDGQPAQLVDVAPFPALAHGGEGRGEAGGVLQQHPLLQPGGHVGLGREGRDNHAQAQGPRQCQGYQFLFHT